MAEANEAMKAAGVVKDTAGRYRAGQVTCGPFLGPDSQGMAATIAHGVCWPNVGWMVFGFTDGAWHEVPIESTLRIVSLRAVGSVLRQKVPVYRPGDGSCTPTGGVQVRTWRWDGARLVPGPWKQLDEPEPRAFRSPSRNIRCEMRDDSYVRGVECVYGKDEIRAVLSPRGRVRACEGAESTCHGKIGPSSLTPPVLAYGEDATVGRFRCRSRKSGVWCTVAETGKGFVIDNTGVQRVGA